MTTVLAADIGGTKTILQVATKTNDGIDHIAEYRFESQANTSFDEILETFLKQIEYKGQIDAACFGVAGPIDGDIAKVTNLPWRLDAKLIAQSIGIEKISLINDFQAIGFGLESLQDEDLFVVQAGRSVEHGVRAIIGAGTGLGVGFMVAIGGRYQVYPSEGGHTGFSPSNALEMELMQFLSVKYPLVSVERVLSGPGLENIYWFFDARQNPGAVKNTNAAEISRMAFDGTNSNAQKAMQLFLGIYGSQAGNLALTYMASGGIYIAGGIAPRIKQHFLDGKFLQAFSRKSKMESIMGDFPIMIVDNPKVGLIGARNVAFHLAR